MRTHRALFAFVFLVLFAVAASAADITGQWQAEYKSDATTGQSTFQFKQDGEKLTGTMRETFGGAVGEVQIQEGKVSGDDVSFVVTRSVGRKEWKLTYAGKVADSEIKFKVSIEGGRGWQMTAKKMS